MNSPDSEFVERADHSVYETQEPVLYSVAEGIATLTMNRPGIQQCAELADDVCAGCGAAPGCQR